MTGQQLQFFYPESPLLKKYIDYYYFLKTDDHAFCSNYYSFPNTAYSLNIHKNVSCQIDGLTIKIKHDPGNDYLSVLQGKYNQPLQVNLQGKIDKITIIFKPLGINSFIKATLGDIAKEPSQVFNCWDRDKCYDDFLNAFYETNELSNRLMLLEHFLLTQYTPLDSAAIMESALHRLTDFDHEYNIAEISASLSINARTFNRLFYKHFATSPVTYRKIARFRHSLKNKLLDKQFESLTQIGYKSNFYDQSYFNKVYRNITGDNPTRFFNSIAKLADDQLVLKFKKK